MKKIILFSLFPLLILQAFAYDYTIISAEEDNTILIDSFEKDMTGDGFQEYIRLHGNILNSNSDFYQKTWTTVQNKFKKEWTVSLQHGYNPEMELIDLTGDKNPDMFYQVAKDEKLAHYHYQLYDLSKNKLKAVELPAHQHSKAELADDFILNLYVNPTEKPLIIDLSDKRDFYIENNVFKENGKPTQEVNATIDQYGTMEPVLIGNSKGYGLKTSHHIHGMDEDDVIGKLETIWHFEKNKWINIKTEVKTDEQQ